MNQAYFFGILSVLLLIISRKSILRPGRHGLYRFLAWEGILWLAVSNYRYWFDDPFSLCQIISWILLFVSLYLAIAGALLLRRLGNAHSDRQDPSLLAFEKTTRLVETGIYKYIRHPMYSSLLFLTWGIFFKHPAAGLSGVALWSSLFLFITALIDEKECVAYFGKSYREYMERTERFVPFLF